jgi:DUF4097 and DUF4098 domain-containing protein YvlB
MKKNLIILLMSIGILTTLNAQKNESDEMPDYQRKTFTVQPGGMLEVEVDPGAVVLETWSKNEVEVEADGIDERYPNRLKVSQAGNTISVQYHDTRHHSGRLVFTIKVPAKFNADIQTSGGSLKQKGSLTGEMKAETQGGSIKIEYIVGNVDLETGGGSIKVEKVEGDARLQTGGGSIETGTITGTTDAHTGGGGITLKETGGKVVASTGGGSINVRGAKAWLELSTGGGSVRVSDAKFGAKVATGGGSVEMEKITGMVNVSTGGGSISCELNPGEKGNSSLKTGGGDIELILPENAKVIVDATIHQGGGWGGHHKDCRVRSDFKADKYEGDDESEEIHAEYIINGGGPRITLVTSGSDIDIRKMSR